MRPKEVKTGRIKFGLFKRYHIVIAFLWSGLFLFLGRATSTFEFSQQLVIQ